MDKRTTDQSASPARAFRSERLFSANGQWYFATREAGDCGPFVTRTEALAAMAAYVDEQVAVEQLRNRLSGADTLAADHEAPPAVTVEGLEQLLHDRSADTALPERRRRAEDDDLGTLGLS